MDTPITPAEQLRPGFERMRAAQRAHVFDANERRARLQKLGDSVRRHCDELVTAAAADFGRRAALETLGADVMVTLDEIRHARRHLRRWMRPQRRAVNWTFLPARSEIRYQPLGVVGVVAPWNYPIQLALVPLANALAAGNRVMIKPSEFTPRVSALLAQMIGEIFPADEVVVVQGGADVGAAFSQLPFDHLLFTGSTRVGRLVAAAAGRKLTPVTLELGGKSPAIIDASANLDDAAERIAYGKLLNAGQTCIAPDYVLVAKETAENFAGKVAASMRRMYGTMPDNPDYTAIISDQHYARLDALVADATAKGARVIHSTSADDPAWRAQRKFPPAVILGVTPEMKVMQEEIFGPLLPIVDCAGTEAAIAFVNERDRPLALYWFGADAAARDEVLARTVSGGVTVNDCLFHFTQINQPMGGVGASGIGAYHGEWGFHTFSKLKPVFYRSKFNRFADLYPPYGAKIARMEKLLRWLS